MASKQVIRRAAALYHDGRSYREIAQELGYASPGTIYRWSQGEVWKDEISILENIERVEADRYYRKSIRKTQKRLETFALAEIEMSARVLATLKEVLDILNPRELESAREQLAAVSTLARSLSQLSESGKNLWIESVGLEEVAKALDRYAPVEDGNQ